VGEIHVSGPSVARSYRNGAPVRNSGGALATGDLGFLRAGELHVTGRLRELIIVAGRNVIPTDVERACETAVAAVRPGCGAAFGYDADGREHVAVVYEVREPTADHSATIAELRVAAARAADVATSAVVLIRPGTLPKTSSGKVRRAECRERFLAGTLDPVASWAVAPAAPDR
jgi:acyl-CoA synthetase (AMP-forming)/AMP-acid ligase II